MNRSTPGHRLNSGTSRIYSNRIRGVSNDRLIGISAIYQGDWTLMLVFVRHYLTFLRQFTHRVRLPTFSNLATTFLHSSHTARLIPIFSWTVALTTLAVWSFIASTNSVSFEEWSS